MTMRDSYNNLVFLPGLCASVSDNTAQVSAIIDTRDYKSMTFAIATGTLADSDATFTVLVEDGDQPDLSDNAAVADDFLIGTEAGASFTFAEDNVTRKIGYIGNKRYVRLTITPANNASAAALAVIAVGKPKVTGTVN